MNFIRFKNYQRNFFFFYQEEIQIKVFHDQGSFNKEIGSGSVIYNFFKKGHNYDVFNLPRTIQN